MLHPLNLLGLRMRSTSLLAIACCASLVSPGSAMRTRAVVQPKLRSSTRSAMFAPVLAVAAGAAAAAPATAAAPAAASVASLLDSQLEVPLMQLAVSDIIGTSGLQLFRDPTDIYYAFVGVLALYFVITTLGSNAIEDAKKQDQANAAKKARSKKIERTTSEDISASLGDFLRKQDD